MTLFKATIEILIEASSEAEACDAVSETLRNNLKKYVEQPERVNFIDWQYVANGGPTPDDGAGFDEYVEERRPQQ